MTKGWKIFWIVFDAIFFGMYFLFPFADTGILYYDGLTDSSLAFTLLLLLLPIGAVWLGILIVRLIFWKQYFRNARTLKIARVGVFVLVLIFNPVTLMRFHAGPPGYKPFTEGFYQRMQERLDAEAIRNWMEGLEDRIFDGNYYDVLYPMEDRILPFPVPQEISKLSEQVHYLRFYMENNERYLRIEWGGPFSRWGVVIGPKDMPIPPTEDVRYDEDGLRHLGEYRLRFEDGVYVWHELK